MHDLTSAVREIGPADVVYSFKSKLADYGRSYEGIQLRNILKIRIHRQVALSLTPVQAYTHYLAMRHQIGVQLNDT